jgi:hypothetical protein
MWFFRTNRYAMCASLCPFIDTLPLPNCLTSRQIATLVDVTRTANSRQSFSFFTQQHKEQQNGWTRNTFWSIVYQATLATSSASPTISNAYPMHSERSAKVQADLHGSLWMYIPDESCKQQFTESEHPGWRMKEVGRVPTFVHSRWIIQSERNYPVWTYFHLWFQLQWTSYCVVACST